MIPLFADQFANARILADAAMIDQGQPTAAAIEAPPAPPDASRAEMLSAPPLLAALRPRG